MKSWRQKKQVLSSRFKKITNLSHNDSFSYRKVNSVECSTQRQTHEIQHSSKLLIFTHILIYFSTVFVLSRSRLIESRQCFQNTVIKNFPGSSGQHFALIALKWGSDRPEAIPNLFHCVPVSACGWQSSMLFSITQWYVSSSRNKK